MAVPEAHQDYIRMILRAVADLIQGEGDVNYVQEQFNNRWQKLQESGEKNPETIIGFDRDSFRFAKELFMKSELY
jgi:hypothetical protein